MSTTSNNGETISVLRRINREGELRLPKDRGPGALVPALEYQHLRHGHGHWWETEYGRWRLRMESAAMERFPGFRLIQESDQLHWVGTLYCRLASPVQVCERGYLVRVSYPIRFPYVAPTVLIERPPLPAQTPHLISQRRPCLYYPLDGSGHGYDRARTTVATLVSWTALWLHALEVWRATGDWPGSGI